LTTAEELAGAAGVAGAGVALGVALVALES